MRQYRLIAVSLFILALIVVLVTQLPNSRYQTGPLSIVETHFEIISTPGTRNPNFVISTGTYPHGAPLPRTVTNFTEFRITNSNPNSSEMGAIFAVEVSNDDKWVKDDSYPVLKNNRFSIPPGGCEIAFEAPHTAMPWRITGTYHVEPVTRKDVWMRLVPVLVPKFTLLGPTVTPQN